jgi:hypothetical protein
MPPKRRSKSISLPEDSLDCGRERSAFIPPF